MEIQAMCSLLATVRTLTFTLTETERILSRKVALILFTLKIYITLLKCG